MCVDKIKCLESFKKIEICPKITSRVPVRQNARPRAQTRAQAPKCPQMPPRVPKRAPKRQNARPRAQTHYVLFCGFWSHRQIRL